MRFIKQVKDHDCGPTAVLNALKMLGFPVTFRSHYQKAFDACEPLKHAGTNWEKLERAMEQLGEDKIELVRRITAVKGAAYLDLVWEYMKANPGTAVIINYRHCKEYRHYAVLLWREKGGYMLANAQDQSMFCYDSKYFSSLVTKYRVNFWIYRRKDVQKEFPRLQEAQTRILAEELE